MKSYTSHYRSPLGNIALATDGTALTALWFEGREQASFPTSESLHTATDDLPIVTEVCRWLDIYFDGRVPDFTPPLLLRGSVPPESVARTAHHSLRPHADLRQPGQTHRLPLTTSCGRCCRPQPHCAHRALPPGGRCRRSPDRLCRRPRPKSRAAQHGSRQAVPLQRTD